MTENPFFAPSALPYHLPPFAEIREEHYAPAFERGMAEQLAEVEAIAGSDQPPTFDNTVAALERSGRLLDRVSAVFFNQASSDTNPTVQEIQKDVTPKLTKHSDAIHLDRRLFARIRAIPADGLDAEERRLLDRYVTDFVRAGAELEPADQERLKVLNEELSTLSTRFEQNLLAAMNAAAIVVDDVAELDGLSEDAVKAAAESARSRGLDGKYVLTLVLPTGQPAMEELADRALRERIHRASTERGLAENSELVLRIAKLRAERAALLGYANHAEYVVADQTAPGTRAVTEMLAKLTPAAVANAHREAEDLREEAGFAIEAWDWSFYAEKVRATRYAIDSRQMRPYFELDRVLRDGVFHAAGKLYGLQFTERPDLSGYHPDVRVFEVAEEDGSPLGLFLGDFYARPSKRGGAWMNSLVKQSALEGVKPVVVNNLNIVKPPAGEPTLMTWEQVNTMFHEFGHALHGLFSDVRFPRFSGTSVPRDFVEYPSQVNEMWATWPEILANYARHFETGEPMPQDLVDRMLESGKFNQGYATVEYLAATLLDWAWHTLTEEPVDAQEFERRALREAGVDLPLVPPRYRSTYFAHIWAGGYSAGYYSYIWSEVLDADTVEWFKESGGLTRENGDTFRRELLSKGGSVDAMTAFRAFRGRDPRIEPLLERRGLL
ncbi:peptidyl-dipeptidase Dcp [Sphaerisporangium melleum]|uniref:Peptidyl-dipeptidase Dcp n=1 Tax=Sphaerisporangium melleum TaxID=321316 RepID=A0A917QV87_9ACTN|nr:M3 family metallopeptidase [Sphaerisporangium melleum]GGK70114.1 peptidyl-dipeptidase Dcp [Sphaerisporangium melleum]GII70320.1 peptidyl-dipeptidase Dcp [Sphaerisporangium melleum]